MTETSTNITATLTDQLIANLKPAGFFSSAGNKNTQRGTSDASPRAILWAARTLESGAIEVTPLFNGLPADPALRLAKRIEKMRFLQQYWPEPLLYQRDAMETIAARNGNSGYPLSKAETMRAYLPFITAYLVTGQRPKAETVVEYLVANGVGLNEKLRLLLNKVAVSLRKGGEPSRALDCYMTLRKFHGEDEHLDFNIARTLFDMKRYKECRATLANAVQLNPDFEPAKIFLSKLQRIPGLRD
ncbi:tetratricopeptide repeat protein [Oleidesulfovibrio sp.]|uniref:tetratricopeptide repeat protein n=1 Tax=Oleidesulfovibrio sp. TaxID=2909707 RepID=UPI003A8AF84A